MKIKLLFLLFISTVVNGYAQPANDLCGNAQPLTVGVGSCTSVLFTNVAATTIGNPPTPACWLPNTMSNTVWFSFSATKPDIEISTNFTGTLADTQIAIFSGGCGALTQLACQEDINTATGLLHTDVILHGLTIGTTYYIAIDGKANTTGTFGVCVQETLPVGPPLLIQDCVGAETMCGLGNIVVADGTGGIGLSQEDPSCFGAPGERSSSWYTFTAASNGNLCFTILPNAPIDYDFAVYNTTASCPGTELACNWDPEDGTGETGLGCTDVTQCESCIAVVAGQSYSILVDRFTANSSSGFTLNFAGTSASFASPNPTFTATSPCVGTATQFTNTTNGNFTYSWNFGDSTTSNLENPTHTYASWGTYNVSLLITAVPGGCQNAVTIPVTVNPLPIVDAGTASGSVCPGSCITLGGSTNATGYLVQQPFSNNTAFAIPDGNAVGVASPITVAGISPATISATSIASVCVNLTHTWDSDLDVFLRCPDGTQIELSTDNGNLGDNYTGTCFSPTAATPITGGTAPFGGSFTPEQSFNLLNGCTANGTWQLFVQDDTGGDTGNIVDWTITFNNNTPPFTWSPSAGMTNANTLTPTVCPAVTTVYTLSGNGAGGCVITDTVTVTVGGGSTANISYAAASFCTSDTPKSVTLTGTGTFTGGTYSSTAGLTINPGTGTITPGTSIPNTYVVTYTIPAVGLCPPVTDTFAVTINAIPNAGGDGGTAICDSNLAVINLFGLITGEQAGGVWTRISGTGGTFNVGAGTFTPAAGATTSTFTYALTGIAPCINDTSIATITITAQPNAGGDGGTAICDSNLAVIDLFTLITGEQAGGVWTRTSGTGGTFNAGAGTFTPVSGATTSTFTYTLTGIAPCINDTSLATITITAQPNAGGDGGTVICDSNLAIIDLFTLITGEQAGGVWTKTSGTGGTFNAGAGTFTPAAGATTSTFTYTLTGIAPCINDTSLATITITAQPNAGGDGGTAICDSNLAVIDLFTLITGEQAGGIWTRTSGTGGTFNAGAGTFTPVSGATTSTFTYTLTGIAPCINDTSLATITITAQPFAGTDGGTIVCDTNTTVTDLFTLITGEQTGGTWTRTSGTGGTFNAGAGTFIPAAGATTSTFTYTLTGTAPCINDTSLATVTVSPTLTPIITCGVLTTTSVQFNWAAVTGATDYAVSYQINANPVVSVGLIGNVLTYTQNGLAPGDTVTFAMVPAGPFGTCFAPATQICTTLNCILPTVAIGYGGTPYCSTTIGVQNVSLTGTGAFTGGTYSSTGGLSINPITGAITPGLSIPGTFIVTYTIPAIAGCSIVTATTSVTVTALPTAAISYAGMPFCITDATAKPVTLNGTAAYTGGTYSSAAGLSINPSTGAITPAASIAGNYLVTYTVPASAGCGIVIASNSVVINPTIAPTINCGVSTISTVQFNWGTVTGATGYDVFYSINANPIVLVGPIGNVLTYTVSGLNSGDNVVLTVMPTGGANTCFAQASQLCSANNCNPPTAAISYPATPYCTSITTAQNASLTGTGIFIGGTYSATAGLTINPVTGAITPSTSNTGTYTVTYTIAAAPGCSPVTATTAVTIAPTPTLPILIRTQPTCTVPTGTITITGMPGLTYSFDGLPYSSTLIYGGLAAGSTHTVTARNVLGCISLVATSTLNAQPVTPAAPVLIKTEPICVLATGTITITGIPGMTYSFDNGPYVPILIYSGLAAGSTHTVTAQNAAGCISLVATATLNAQPTTPAAPILTATQPSCAAPTGIITITGVTGMTYSFDNSPYTTTLVYGGLMGGTTHTVRAQNAAGCISLPTLNTLNAQPATPATPIIAATQPTCTLSTGSITITAVAGLTYSFDSGPFNATLAYSGLPAGSLHTVTAKNSLGCISLPATIALNAQPITPVATATPNLQTICSGNATAIALSSTAVGTTYSWTVVQTNVSGATGGSGNTIAQTLTATNIISGQAIYTITPVANGCTGLPVTVTITVNPRPIAFANPLLQTICSNETTNIQLTTNLSSEPSFNWTVNQIGTSGATSGSGSTIIQTLTATGTIPGTVIYTITPIKNGCTGTPIVVPVTVNPRPQVIGFAATQICTGQTLNIPLLSNISGATFTWTASQTNVNGAADGSGNTISQTLDLSGTNPGTVIYKIEPTVNGCVGAKATVTVTVNPLPTPSLIGGIVCVDEDSGTTTQSYLLDAGLNNANYDFKWYLDGNIINSAVDNTYDAQLPGTYSVVATNANSGCISQPVSTLVEAAFIAKKLLVTVTDAFTDNPTVVAIVTGGTGPFQYQLDNGAQQSSNVFADVSSGTHTVYVTDVNSCTDLKQEVVVIDYPKFFTPNGDGYNDYWNIFQLSDQPNSKIFIFDRYGKFIKEISPRGKGWDGTYGGHQLPSTDYWFSVDYLENNISKTFKSHFSLKR